MKKRIRFGIFSRILVTILAVALLPLGAQWYVNYTSSLHSLSTHVDQLFSAQAAGDVTYVETWMDMHLKVLRQSAALDDMISMDTKRQVPILRAIADEYPWLSLLHTIAPDGKNMARSDAQTPKDYGDRVYFQQAMRGEPFGRQMLMSRTTGLPSLVLAVPIRNRAHTIIGVLGLTASIAELSDHITHVHIGNTGYAYLLDDQGQVVAHQKKEFTTVLANFSTHPAFRSLAQATKQKLVFTDDTTGKKTLAYAQRTRYGWILVVQQDYEEAYAAVTEANRNALLVLGITFMLVIVLGGVLAGRVSRPIMRNITERQYVQEALRAAKEAAEQANRAKSQFLANMSHELRTPLNAILGYSDLLCEEAEELGNAGCIPDLRKIHTAGQHLLALINDILDISKIEAGKMSLNLETFDVPDMIQDVVTTLAPLSEKQANTLHVHCAEDLGSMYTDVTKVRQVLCNLLSNASKFTDHGSIMLQVARQVVDEQAWFTFRVTDTGIGMTPEQMGGLFQSFSQADPSTTRKYGGTGLGLAISKHFCHMLGGDIRVESELGKGSSFIAQFPGEAQVPGTAHPSQAEPPALDGAPQDEIVPPRSPRDR